MVVLKNTNQFKKIIKSIDQIVVICDNKAMNNQKDIKEYEITNNPNQYHLVELLDIIDTFAI